MDFSSTEAALRPFLALPAELRVTIYELILTAGAARTIVIQDAHSKPPWPCTELVDLHKDFE